MRLVFLNCFISILLLPSIRDGFAQVLTAPERFPFQNSTVSTIDQPQPIWLNDGRLLMAYCSNDTIYSSLSTDEGLSWNEPVAAAVITRKPGSERVVISGTVTNTGRIAVIYSVGNIVSSYIIRPLQIIYSDDKGLSWSQSKNVLGGMYMQFPSLYSDKSGTLWIPGRDNSLFYSTDNGNSWNYRYNRENTFHSLVQSKDGTLLGFFQKNTGYIYSDFAGDIYLKKSTDYGITWSDSITVAADNLSEERPRALITSDGTVYIFYQIKRKTFLNDRYNNPIFQFDICFRKSTDNGNIWSEPVQFTKYAGYDGEFNVALSGQKIFISFLSDRYSLKSQIWTGFTGTTSDESAPPVLYDFANASPVLNTPVTVKAFTGSHAGISGAEILYSVNRGPEQAVKMHDDGMHNDGNANDNIWAGDLPAIELRSSLECRFRLTDKNSLSVTFPGKRIFAQVLYSWMAAGSLHNFYSNMGAKIEGENTDGLYWSSQYGWAYPGIYKYQDMQNWKGLWIGSAGFTDETENFYPYKVVHAGPRVTGQGEFFPVDFKTYSRFIPSKVVVNAKESFYRSMRADIIDPSISADRMIINTVNTQLGLTFRCRIMQFSRQFHDNYIIQEYTFKNTGNTDADDTVELPGNTLKDLYFYFNYSWKINLQVLPGFLSSPFLLNTMYDARGDGVLPDPQDENYRTVFGWHGYYKRFHYNTIGGPVWDPSNFRGPIDRNDSTGRLASPQFAGVLTLHSDKSPADRSDNPGLPQVTYVDNDHMLFFNNSAYDHTKMKSEYLDLISKQKDSVRHAYKIHPAAMAGGAVNFQEFANQTTDPSKGTGGGYGVSNSYGPYNLTYGDSITIIIAEGAASISREAAAEMGKKYKDSYGTSEWNNVEKEKNLLVLTGKDSLMQTWKRATENYKSGWRIPVPPNPPEEFTVTSLDDRICLGWKAGDPSVKGFEIYRTSGNYEKDYRLIKSLPADARSFQDLNVTKGEAYYYYILSTGNEVPADARLNTPAFKLKSSRYYTQTYHGASIGTSGSGDEDKLPMEFRLYANYPNPFNPLTTISYQLPKVSMVTLKVYDILGKEVSTLVNEFRPAGRHKLHFSGSRLPSGVYIYTIQAGEFRDSKKLMLLK